MIYEFVCDGKVYGTMPLYKDGEPVNPYGRMIELIHKYNLPSIYFRIGRVDLR